MNSQTQPITATVLKLSTLVVAMFVFAVYIMPPMYDLFCEVTGLNGKTGDQYQAKAAGVDESRSIKVQFLATNNENMTWGFSPEIRSIHVHPGEEIEVNFLAENTTPRPMVAQAVPSVVPFKAAEYFHKTECFCFNQQELAAGETAKLPLRFIVDLDVPKQVHTITLSYTLFDVTDRFSQTQKLVSTR